MISGCYNELPRVTERPQPDSVERSIIDTVIVSWDARVQEQADLQLLDNYARTKMHQVLITDAADVHIFHDLCRVCAPVDVEPKL